ncbi:MAG TPA: ATP-binding protein [Pyrinomonadaceae bacterium]|nr:ATP-binding protein [Pyrinomonadaceae bacterium]
MKDVFESEIKTETVNKETGSTVEAVGRIAAPIRFEATPNHFYFWAKRGIVLEENQIVFSESITGGENIKFYGVIDEIRRTSRRADMTEEYDIADGDVDFEPQYNNEGFTYAHAQVLRIEPEISTPPIERSIVSLGGEAEAKIAYGFDEMSRPMPIGLLKNGARKFAGNGLIDLDYLLGENGGHLNVNGMAGVGTKTTFLLTTIKSLQKKAEVSKKDGRPFHIVPIILNVKGEDLMWLNRKNTRFSNEHEADWEALGIAPEPFTDAEFYTAQDLPVHGCNSKEYSWSLQDVLNEESMLFIFSEDDNLSANMTALVREIVADITEKDGKKLKPDWTNWKDLLEWMGTTNVNARYGAGTWWAVYRRLWKVLDEGKNIFPKEAKQGNPMKIARNKTAPPQVIDISQIPYSLQRFVVGSILKQAVQSRKSATAVPNLRYVIMLDELNRFAPRGAKDELTQLLEQVATEMRSQGVILLGAQQMASQVSNKVVEMASIRALGRTGSAELSDKIWSVLEKPTKEKAVKLSNKEKLVWQPTFRQPMLVKMPMNPWADKRDHISSDVSTEDINKL